MIRDEAGAVGASGSCCRPRRWSQHTASAAAETRSLSGLTVTIMLCRVLDAAQCNGCVAFERRSGIFHDLVDHAFSSAISRAAASDAG